MLIQQHFVAEDWTAWCIISTNMFISLMLAVVANVSQQKSGIDELCSQFALLLQPSVSADKGNAAS